MPLNVVGLVLSMEPLANRFFPPLILMVLSSNPFSQQLLPVVNDFSHKLESIVRTDQRALVRPASLEKKRYINVSR